MDGKEEKPKNAIQEVTDKMKEYQKAFTKEIQEALMDMTDAIVNDSKMRLERAAAVVAQNKSQTRP